MKRLAIAMTLGILLMGCSESAKDTQGRSVAEKNEDGTFSLALVTGSGEHRFYYVMVDGHEYLLMWGTHRSGITHSPKCPCLKNKMEIVFPLNTVTNEMTGVVPL